MHADDNNSLSEASFGQDTPRQDTDASVSDQQDSRPDEGSTPTKSDPSTSAESESPQSDPQRKSESPTSDETKPQPTDQRDPMEEIKTEDIGSVLRVLLKSVGRSSSELNEILDGDLRIERNTKEQAREVKIVLKFYNHYYGPVVDKNIGGAVSGEASGSVNIGNTGPGADTTTEVGKDAGEAWSFGHFILSQERVDDIGYVLALAALAGAPLSTVNRAADELVERLRMLRVVDPEKPAPHPIEVCAPRTTVIAEIGCSIFTDQSDEPGGELPCQRAVFREPSEAQALLRHAWTSLRLSIAWMGVFLEWLSDQGRDRDLELRLAAGRTVGVLTTWDRPAAEGVLFESWTSGRALDALGAGLIALAGASNAHEKYVEDRLLRWIEGKDGRYKIVAAAMLANGAFGHAVPDLAFRVLSGLVCQRRHLTIDLAAMGYAVWFATAADEPQIGVRVIKEISTLRSENEDRLVRRLTGVFFLLLTAAIDGEPDDEYVSERLFLDVLDSSPEALRLAAKLFNEVLAPSTLARPALDRFQSVCFCAISGELKHQRVLFALVESMQAQGDDDDRDTLTYWLSYWLDEIRERSIEVGRALETWLKRSKRVEVA